MLSLCQRYGRSRLGKKSVTDNKGVTKDVTIMDESSGQTNTLRLKDSQTIENIQEVDTDYDYVVDQQIVTVCDSETKTCNVITIDLDDDYVDPGYADYAKQEIGYAEEHMPYEHVSAPIIVDPISVGAEADDVCWLEDIIVGVDYNGDAIVETEVFCADGESLYMNEYTEDYKGVDKTKPDLYAEPVVDDWYGDAGADDWYDDYAAEEEYEDDTTDDWYDAVDAEDLYSGYGSDLYDSMDYENPYTGQQDETSYSDLGGKEYGLSYSDLAGGQ